VILIVGGEGSGKRSYARALGWTDADMADGVVDGRPVIFHTERLTMADPDCGEAVFEALKDKAVVICSEVGSGIIPIDPQQRRGREETGRLCTRLAREATAVVRMVCGLPTALKGELP